MTTINQEGEQWCEQFAASLTPAQKALAECRQAIRDIAERPLSGPEHAALKRRAEHAERRVCELREQVQKQINLRVAAEQRAGNRNVSRLENENAELRRKLADATQTEDPTSECQWGAWP